MLKLCLFAISIRRAFEMLEQENEGITEALRVKIISDPRITKLAMGFTKYTELLKKQYNNDIQRLHAKYKRFQREQYLKHEGVTKVLHAMVKEKQKEHIQDQRKAIEKYKMELADLEGMMLTTKRRTHRNHNKKMIDLWKVYDTTDEQQLKKFIDQAEEIEAQTNAYFNHYDKKYITESSRLKEDLLLNLKSSEKKFEQLAEIAASQKMFKIDESVTMKLEKEYDQMKIRTAEKYRKKEDDARLQLDKSIHMLAVSVKESSCSESMCDHVSKQDMSVQISEIIFKKMEKEFDLLPKIPDPSKVHNVVEMLKDYAESFKGLFKEGDVEEMTSLPYYMMRIVQIARDPDFDEHSDQYHFPCKERYQREGDAFVQHCNEYQLAVKLLTGEQLWAIWLRLGRYHNFV